MPVLKFLGKLVGYGLLFVALFNIIGILIYM